MRLGSSFFSIKYEEYVQAFKYAGIDPKMISDPNELRKWDTEYLELCMNALRKIQVMKPDDKVEDQDRRFGTFKSASDSTDYDGWGHHKEDMKYAELVSLYQIELSKFKKRLELNKK
jgi:regulator of RNase E activity RraB